MQIARRSSQFFSTTAVALFVAALFAVAGFAATSPDQTRESYVAQVEPICKTNTKANERILAGAEKRVKEGKLKVAARQFTQAAAAFKKAVRQIKAVVQPVADQAKLKKWTGALEDETKFLSEIGTALKAGNKARVSKLSLLLKHNGNVANNAVLGFDFDYCLIDSSKFS
jgi:hypothetical protein